MTELKQRTQGRVLLLELAGETHGDANPLDSGLREQLTDAWSHLDENDDLRVAVLAGSGGAFSRGQAPDDVRRGIAAAWELNAFPLHTSKPVIAAVEGVCHGGGFELALACDLRIAAEGSSFGFPDLDAPGPFRVASVLLPRITFAGLSQELLMSAKTLDSTRAYQARLINRVVKEGEALQTAVAIAEALANKFGAADFKKQRILRMSGVPVVTAMSMARDS